MKRLLSIALAIILTFSLVACGERTIEHLPKKDRGEFPSILKSDGYTISGKAYDQAGATLQGAQILVNGKTMAITDENGFYEIKSLTGTNTVSINFYDYQFDEPSFEVNERNTALNFIGEPKTPFSVSASCKTLNGLPLYGIIYNIDTREEDPVRERPDGKGYVMYNMGRTVITPKKSGFTFYPESATVYTSGTVEFTAIPNDDTMTVSGELDFTATNNMSAVSIMVNGQKYTQSEIKMTSEGQKAFYTIYGLKADGTYHYISAGMGIEGSISENDYVINAESDSCDFIMRKAKNVRINLKFSTGKDIPNDAQYYYYVDIYNEHDLLILHEKVSNKKYIDGVDIWEGCKVYVYSPSGYFTSIHEEITEQFMDSATTEVDVRCTLA
ncbi:MAG: carboxypeptidase regulatory-like domain-containing protein [Clostridia bacterium]|nr:carboxypeptidase regulatory-like domain-containing protein [Clostridia bacterium]